MRFKKYRSNENQTEESELNDSLSEETNSEPTSAPIDKNVEIEEVSVTTTVKSVNQADGIESSSTMETSTKYVSVNELVPVSNLQDDFRRIAYINDEFTSTMDPILRMYNAAMNETATRMAIIKDEFKYRGLRCPIHHIDTRLKSIKSILGKLEKKGLPTDLSSACNNLFDIAGVRVVCPYIKDVYLIRDRIMAQDDLQIMEIKDYIAEPKPNGYRSLHMIIRIPVYFMNKKQYVPVEIQLRTEAMDLWASLEHDIKYKSLYQGDNFDFSNELLEASKLIYQAEAKMEYMNNMLED